MKKCGRLKRNCFAAVFEKYFEFQVMITFGQVTSALVDALFAKSSDGWRWDFGLAAVPALILLIGFIF